MENSDFFEFRDFVSLDEILALLRASSLLIDPSSSFNSFPRQFSRLSSLVDAGSEDISFFYNSRYTDDLRASEAGLILVPRNLSPALARGKPVMPVLDVHHAMAIIGSAFVIEPEPSGVSHPTAFVAPDAEIGPGVTLGPKVVVGSGARIGGYSQIGALTHIDSKVVIGTHCQIGSNVTISYAHIGNDVHIKHGARLGQRGFGWALNPDGHIPKPQVGRVIVEDKVEIGANTAIDRGSLHDTFVGQGTVIDNLCHIAHNCRIGRGCAIAGATALAGTTVLGDFVQIGGNVASKGHVSVGEGAIVRIDSFIGSNIGPGQDVAGRPARPIQAYRRLLRHWSRAARGAKGN